MRKTYSLSRFAARVFVGLLSLLCLALPQAASAAPTTSDTPTAGDAVYRFWSVGHSGSVLIANSGYARRIDQSSADETQYWQLEAQSDGSIALKNVSTGTYLGENLTKDASFPMSSTAVGFSFSVINTNYYAIKCGSSDYGLNATDQSYVTSNSDGLSASGYRVCAWDAGTSNTGSHWIIEKVYDSLEEYNNPSGLPSTAYVFTNVQYSGNVLAVSGTSLARVASSSADATQYWSLVDTEDGNKALYNLATQTYVQTTGWNTAYTMGSTPSSFTISQNSTNSAYYDIKDVSSGNGLNATDNSISGGFYRVYNWAVYDGNNANSAWTYEQVTLTDDIKNSIVQQRVLSDVKSALANGAIRIKSRRSNGYYITDNAASSGNTCVLAAEKSSGSDDYYQQVWVVQASGSGYTLLNLATGKYLNPGSTSSSATAYYFYINADNAADEKYVNFSKNNTQTGNGIHYQVNGDLVVEWSMTAGEGSDWLIEDVSDEITADVIKAKISALSGEVATPAANTYYIIRNMSNDNVMTEDYTNAVGTVVERDAQNYAQLWRLVSTSSDGYYNLQNALTGNYVQYQVFNSQHSIAAAATDGFYLKAYEGESVKFHSYYAFLNSGTSKGTAYSLHRSSERLLTWTSYSEGNQISGSLWYFQEAGVTEEQITAAQNAYKTNQTERDNASTYTSALTTFFTDKACTTLNSTYASYTDDELKTAMSNAGITSSVLQEMAVKVKNNSWADWEKTFRVMNLEPHSNPATWANLLNLTQYSEVPNPTGIVNETSSLAYIFVGSDIPEGCSLDVRVVTSASSQGSKVTLSSGLNIVPVSKAGALFLNYITPVTLTSDKTLADYPVIPIHIEGGTVNGYFDLTRSEIGTDEAWAAMKNAGLLTHDFMQMKGNHVIMNMTTSYVKQYVSDTQMEDIVGFWDWVCKTEQELMGIDKYRTQQRWNDLEGCYSVTNSYMYATTYGTYYNETTLNTILNYEGMKTAGGNLWGPAHEMGHNHQNQINVTGTTEISNNLFSAVAVYKNGRTSNRNGGKSSTDLANHYANGDTWIDIQSDNWIPTHMFYQLYLYYEVLGNHPGFWADVFDALREDPIRKSTNSSSPAPATNDFLHLAVKCCDVAQEDLSEFFQAYCMFFPFEARLVEDYANYYIENTEAQIAEAKAAMQKYPKASSNILFLDDHIKYFEAIDHNGNVLKDESGNTIMRTDYEAGVDAVGSLGDVGSFTDYVDGNYASGYTYTYSDGTLTFSSSDDEGTSNAGAMGYKVYDADGNLLYFSNKNSFTLPSSISEKVTAGTISLVVKVAQADGSDVTLPAADADTYTLKVYRADALSSDKSTTLYTDATEATLPTLADNDIVFIESSDAPESLTALTNYVDASNNTAAKVVLSDKKDYVAPSAFTATSLTYERTNTAGWNSVCLPFAFTAADLGEGSSIEQFSYMTDDNASAIFTSLDADAETTPGQGYFVNCPEDVTSWTITKENAVIAATPLEAETGLVGSFVNATIGEGKYKLNTAGTQLGVTSAAGKVTAFRSYLNVAASDGAAPRVIALTFEDGSTTGATLLPDGTLDTAPIYDLNGRRVSRPTHSGIYIQSGRKVFVK